MGKAHPIIHAKDEISPAPLSTEQIEKMLSELSRLYLERFKALRSGDQDSLQALTNQITDIKTVLGQI